MYKRENRPIVVVVVVLLMISSAMTAMVAPVSANDHTDPPPEGELIEADTDVEVWDRAFLTTRANTSDAAQAIRNAGWFVNYPNSTLEPSLNQDPITVYEPNDTVSIEFDASRVNRNGNYDGNETEIIAAHIDESGQGSVPDSVSKAIDLVTEENANDNATFESVGNKPIENGTLSFDYTPEESGHYMFVLAKEDGDGLVVSDSDNDDDGEISVDSPATIIGMEWLVVREGTGTVSPPSSISRGPDDESPEGPGNSTPPDLIPRGTDAVFDVNATGVAGTDIKQSVVLYDESTFINQKFTVDIQEELSRDFDIGANSTLETSISGVNGVGSLEESISAFGVDINDGTVSRTAGIESIFDFVGEELGAETPDTNVTAESTVLDASMTVVNRTTRDTNLTVGTFGNWSTGEYRWVYAAVGNSSQEMVMDTGTVTVTGQGSNPPPLTPTPDNDLETNVTSDGLDFGTVTAGSSQTQIVTVSNTGDVTLDIDSVTVSGADAFSASSSDTTIGEGESTTVSITFAPDSPGAQNAELEIQSTDPDSGPETVSLSGTGTGPVFNASPLKIDLGDAFTDTQLSQWCSSPLIPCTA